MNCGHMAMCTRATWRTLVCMCAHVRARVCASIISGLSILFKI